MPSERGSCSFSLQPSGASPEAASQALPSGSARNFSFGPRKPVCGDPPSAGTSRGCLVGSWLAGWRKHCSLDQIPRFNRENASIDVFINLTVKVGTGTCCPGRLWMSQPWKCSRPGWIRLWATWSSGRGPCLWQGGLGLYL